MLLLLSFPALFKPRVILSSRHPSPQKTLVRGTFWLFLDRMLRMMVGFGAGIVIARAYGPQPYGEISYLIALTALFGSLASFGLDELLPRDLAAGIENLAPESILKTGVYLRLTAELSALGLLCLTLLLGPFDPDTQALGSLLGLYYLLQVTDTIEFSLRVQGHFAAIAFSRITASLLSAAIKVILALLHFPLWSIVLAMLFEYGINSLMFTAAAKLCPNWRIGKFDPGYAKSLLKRAFPLVLSGFVLLLQARIDTFYVERYFGHEALGQYAAALRLTELLDMTAIVLSLLLIPDFGRLKGRALDQRIEMAYLAGTGLFLLSLPGLVLVYFFFSEIYGPGYAQGSSLIPWLAARPFFYILAVIRGASLVAKGSLGLIPVYPTLSITLIALSFDHWAEAFGLEGAAMAGSFSIGASALITDLLFNRENLMRILKSPLALPGLLEKLKRSSPGISRPQPPNRG